MVNGFVRMFKRQPCVINDSVFNSYLKKSHPIVTRALKKKFNYAVSNS